MAEDPLLGRQLGNFRIERRLGRGGMAQVYRGWDVKLERPVAIKVIDARFRDRPTYAKRFVREAQTVATWRHENIIQIYYADEQDGLYYFVMEYIDGPDLDGLFTEYARQGELVPHNDVLRLGRAIADALDYAHEQGVIHRDVKPSNVMLARDGRVVLTDFGLAMDVHVGTLGEAFGSPHHLAPEQARSSAEAVPQSDLYALGVILYQLLTGELPFDDPSALSLALQHLTQPPPSPRKTNPDLSPEAEAVLLKALSKSPDERYQSGAALLGALEAALESGQEPQAQPADESAAATRSLSSVSVDEMVASHLQADAQPASARDFSPQPMGNLTGRQLDEYRLEALLGHGGMARVYRGLDVRLQRHAAIKVIDIPFRSDSKYAERFEREAQAAAQLEHPHIVRLYRYGEVDGLLYMAMQYIRGADLAFVLNSYKQDQEFIEPEEASRLVREVCSALDYAHSQGVIHRDVKPSNIMLDQEGCAYLTDFGLALLTHWGTRGEVFGSPQYIAPEQAISSADVVPQTDLYAVGVILYEIFTGQLPFDAEDPMDTATMHINETPRSPSELRPDINPELEAVILKAMAKAPRERYQSGAELADALDQALQAQPAETSTKPPATVARLSMLERVHMDVAEKPLPPIPAAVAVPGPWPAEPETDREPAAPAQTKRCLLMVAGLGVATGLCWALLLAVGLWLSGKGGDEQAVGLTATERGSVGAVQRTATASHTADIATASRTADVATASPTADIDTATPSPSAEVATASPTAGATSTPIPRKQTPTSPRATATTQATAEPGIKLLIAARGEESLFVVNQAKQPFPLDPLLLQNNTGQVSGSEWGARTLRRGECVALWQDSGKPKPPHKLKCVQVGKNLTREGPDRFWKNAFNVYYNGEPIGSCSPKPTECKIP